MKRGTKADQRFVMDDPAFQESSEDEGEAATDDEQGVAGTSEEPGSGLGEEDGEDELRPSADGEGTDEDGEPPSTSGPAEDGVAGTGRKKAKKVLSEEKLRRIKEIHEKRGIVYVSRIPPHMKPLKLRQLLAQYGEINRVYCAPEDMAARRARKQKGKDTGKNFTEGWVEFEDKRIAKRVAVHLNGKNIGGRKRSAYYYDLWCLKYLPKFKWDHLTEEINYQKAVREQKLLTEISAAKRERDFYLSRVDKAKAVEAIKERKQKQQAAAAADGDAAQPAHEGGAGGAAAGAEGGREGFVERRGRHFGQRRAKLDPVSDPRAPEMADDVLGMLAGGGGQAKKKQRTG